MKFAEIIAQNQQLKADLGVMDYKIAILSNIVVSQSQNLIEYELRSRGVKAEVILGDYDTIVQDAEKLNTAECAIVFWELANLIDGFQYYVETISDEMLTLLIEETKQKISLCVKHLTKTPLILMNRFSTLVFNANMMKKNKLDKVCDALNHFLETLQSPTFLLIDIDKIIATLGVNNSVDFRYFYASKSLYSVEFYKAYACFIAPAILSVRGKAKKALIFDCDNTLWNGIVGEDGFEGICMSSKTSKGVVFEEIQHIALMLSKQGVIVGLCSKNNPEDVRQVLEVHPDWVLKEEFLVIQKINWNDKASNLRAIAKELNIGLESIVFVDDSAFEVNWIKEQLPMVTVLHVPEKNSEYPMMLRKNLSLFFNLSSSKDDLQRVKDYKNNLQREALKECFETMEGYLRSLEIHLHIHHNNLAHIARIAQLTQKTNQFNLTTKRYTEVEIEKFMVEMDYEVLSVEVFDKFSDSGITAVCIMKLIDDKAVIDSLMMSCRILGRTIELALWNYIREFLHVKGIKTIEASYIRTLKNEQVSCLYETFGLDEIKKEDEIKYYSAILHNSIVHNIDYIKVTSNG